MHLGPPRPVQFGPRRWQHLDAGRGQPVIGLGVALVGTTTPGASARVLLPSSHCSRSAVTRSRPGVDDPQPSIPIAAAAAATNGCSSRIRTPPSRLVVVNADWRVAHRRIHHHRVDVDHRAHGVQVHGGPLRAIGTARTVCARSSSNRLRAKASAPAEWFAPPRPRPARRARAATSPPSTGAVYDS